MRERPGCAESNEKTGGDLPKAARHDEQKDVANVGPERHTYTDLLRARAGCVRDDSVDANRGHKKRDQSEPKENPAEKAQEPNPLLNRLIKTVRVAQGQVGIEALDSRAHRGKRTVGGFDKQRHVTPAILTVRHE